MTSWWISAGPGAGVDEDVGNDYGPGSERQIERFGDVYLEERGEKDEGGGDVGQGVYARVGGGEIGLSEKEVSGGVAGQSAGEAGGALEVLFSWRARR